MPGGIMGGPPGGPPGGPAPGTCAPFGSIPSCASIWISCMICGGIGGPGGGPPPPGGPEGGAPPGGPPAGRESTCNSMGSNAAKLACPAFAPLGLGGVCAWSDERRATSDDGSTLPVPGGPPGPPGPALICVYPQTRRSGLVSNRSGPEARAQGTAISEAI
jgi:hypothetical protein